MPVIPTYLCLMFVQCLHQKLPYLLSVDVMHRLNAITRLELWHEWEGPLAPEITTIAREIFGRLIERSIHNYTMMIAHIDVGKGGLGLMNPAQQVIPDFVLDMASSMCFVTQGYRYNKDL